MKQSLSPKPITLIGVPLDLGAKNLGVNIGPEAFRHQRIVEKLRRCGLDVTDAGNISVGDRKDLDSGEPKLRYLDEIVRVNTRLAHFTQDAITAGHKVVVVGGDHSVNLGAMSGASVATKDDIGLIYFDAHGDMNTDKTTLSGNIHGMHLASLLGFGSDQLKSILTPKPKLAAGNLLHVGGSDWDQAELDLVASAGLKTFTLFDLLTKGMGDLIAAIDTMSDSINSIWISLDLDCIDQIYAPGAGMPNAKGMTYREIATIAEYIGANCNVIGVDVVEYNPLQDENGKTAELGIELIAKFLGYNYSWYVNYMDQNQL